MTVDQDPTVETETLYNRGENPILVHLGTVNGLPPCPHLLTVASYSNIGQVHEFLMSEQALRTDILAIFGPGKKGRLLVMRLNPPLAPVGLTVEGSDQWEDKHFACRHEACWQWAEEQADRLWAKGAVDPVDPTVLEDIAREQEWELTPGNHIELSLEAVLDRIAQ